MYLNDRILGGIHFDTSCGSEPGSRSGLISSTHCWAASDFRRSFQAIATKFPTTRPHWINTDYSRPGDTFLVGRQVVKLEEIYRKVTF